MKPDVMELILLERLVTAAFQLYNDNKLDDAGMTKVLFHYEEKTGRYPEEHWQHYMEIKHPQINYKLR